MGVADFEPGDYVAHPSHGACRVLGVGDVTAAGETFAAIALAPFAHPSAIVRVPVAKLAGVRLRVVTAAEADAMPLPDEEARNSWREQMRRLGKMGGAVTRERFRQQRINAR